MLNFIEMVEVEGWLIFTWFVEGCIVRFLEFKRGIDGFELRFTEFSM